MAIVMHLEIERRFLASPEALRECVTGCSIVQGYLRADDRMTVRVRVAGDEGFLTIKGKRSGYVRLEHENRISLEMARRLLARLPAERVVEKTRYLVEVEGAVWEVDVFAGLNAGLIIAEIELDRPDRAFVPPDWIGEEVTQDRRYSNSGLARHPFSQWRLVA